MEWEHAVEGVEYAMALFPFLVRPLIKRDPQRAAVVLSKG
jgi:hypothetical protein